ncbi:hypothetical protein CVT25_009178, partial [Psilocybe cyanescens]
KSGKHLDRPAVAVGLNWGFNGAQTVGLSLKVAIADVTEDKLAEVVKTLAIIGDANVLVVPTDVSKLDQVVRLRDRVYEAWGEVAVLMNNAGIGPRGTSWEGIDDWHKIFDVNLFGMLHQENPAMVITTGSKQGITNPPGNAAYNASKAAVKSLTEGLGNVTAHLFISRRTSHSPGWTYTSLTGASSASSIPAGAWSAEETVLYMLDKVRLSEFYVLVPDNETKREVDQLRIMWAAADVAEGRPALSRWHANWKALYEEYVREGLAQLE